MLLAPSSISHSGQLASLVERNLVHHHQMIEYLGSVEKVSFVAGIEPAIILVPTERYFSYHQMT